MKQLLILSGKGGTGKTTVAGAFIKLSKAQAYADCDVDAPNLHLIMEQTIKPIRKNYYGLQKAIIDQSKCIQCGLCKEKCAFDAINFNGKYEIDNNACEGCAVCSIVCPVNAISMNDEVAGELTLYKDKSVFSTAQLKMGSGTSGKLVSEVKIQMKDASKDANIAIIDGSPGIGCPVIASLSGVYMVLIVTEPTISGISDMKRIIKTAQNFGTKIAVCINKYDINLSNSKKIEDYCQKNDLLFVGEIPYDTEAIKAINDGKTIVDVKCKSGEAMKKIYKKVICLL